MCILNRAEKEGKEIKKYAHNTKTGMCKLHTQVDASWTSVIAVTDSSLFLILVLLVLPKIVSNKSNSWGFLN